MECIEGDWKEYQFKRILESDLPVVLEFLRKEFYIDEPLSQLVGFSDERASDLDRLFSSAVKQDGVSFLVLHRESKKVAAVQISDLKVESSPLLPVTSVLTQIVRKYLGSLYNGIDICRDYNVSVAYELFATSIAREFRGQGLVHEMYARVIKMCKVKNISVISGTFTHPGTRRVASKCGFQEVRRKLYSDHTDEGASNSQECLFPNLNKLEAGSFAAIMVLKIPVL